MNSKSYSNGGSKGEASFTASPGASTSKQNQSPPTKNKKKSGIRTTFAHSSPSTSIKIQEPTISGPPRTAVSSLDPKKTCSICQEVKTSTLSVLKVIRDNKKRGIKSITEGLQKNQICSYNYEGQTRSVSTSSPRNISEEEIVLNIIDYSTIPSLHDMEDCNGAVDLSDLELLRDVPVVQHLNNYGTIRKSSGQTDFTHVENLRVDDIENVGYPYLKDAKATTALTTTGSKLSSNGESEMVSVVPSMLDLQDQNCRSVKSSVRIVHNLDRRPSCTITRNAISLGSFSGGQAESLNVLQPALSDNFYDRHSNGWVGSDNSDNRQVNVLVSTSEYDIVYAPDRHRAPEENPVVDNVDSPSLRASHAIENLPQVRCEMNCLRPVNSKFDQNESDHGLVTTPCFKPIVQLYMVGQSKLSANGSGTDTSEEKDAPYHSDSQLIDASSTSHAEREVLQETGSDLLVKSLPGLGGHHAQFDPPRLLPTAQEQREVEEEMLRLATRSKHYAPPMEFELNEWQSIVQVLTMNEPEVVKKVLRRLSSMTTKRVCDLVKFYNCGLYENLLALLQDHPDEHLIQNLALKLMAELSVLPDCRVQLLSCQWLLLQCIAFLKDDTSSLHYQECASKIISAVATDKRLQLSLLHEHNMIEVLLPKIKKTTDPDIRSNCMEIMLRIIKNETVCKSLIRSEHFDIPTYCMLLESEYLKIKQLTLGLFVLITRYETGSSFQEQINESGLAQIMMTILQTEAMFDMYHLVIEILCNIANTVYGLSLLRNCGLIQYLVDYVHTAGKGDLLGCCLDIIVKLSVSAIGRTYLLELKVPGRLVKYLKMKEDTILERSCVAMSNLSENLGAVNEMVTEKPAEDLIRLIFEDNVPRIKFAASRAMYELAARDERMCQYIAELHLTEVFHHNIWSGMAHIPTLSSISDTIQTISHYPYLKQYMINEESMACFLDIIQGYSRKLDVSKDRLRDEEALRVSAIQCLRCYMSEPECRKLFLNASGVYVVRSTLQSISIQIRQATAIFIELAARDPTITRAMVVAGIIPIMVGDAPMKAACPAWRKALDQIYNHHLPSKFAYCNRLDMTDITSEGFYVAATKKGEIQVLDNLLNDRKCPMEIIYVCNFELEHHVPFHAVPSMTRQEWQPSEINTVAYPPALAALGDRCMATIWQRKASLLYGESSDGSHDNGLQLLRDESRTSSVNRLLKDRMNKQRSSLNSVKTYYKMPKVYETINDKLNLSLEEFGVCPIDHELHRCLKTLRSELDAWLIPDGEHNMGGPHPYVAEAGVVSVTEILANFVANHLAGNANNMRNMRNFLNVSLWDLKGTFQSSILPLGHLKGGLHLERALLFKILADKIGLPCTFVRGQYGITYNEIRVPCDSNEVPVHLKKMNPHLVVDLMDYPGRLYAMPSQEACEYCNIPF